MQRKFIVKNEIFLLMLSIDGVLIISRVNVLSFTFIEHGEYSKNFMSVLETKAKVQSIY